MNLDAFLTALGSSPLIASVQASPGSPMDDPVTIARLAAASFDLAGAQPAVRVLRLQGVANISAVRSASATSSAITIGLIKRDYEGSDVYITPTQQEIAELIGTGCEVIALDGTACSRPNQASLDDLIASIHAAGRLAMADIDSAESAQFAISAGADLLSTTLSGYTRSTAATRGPDLELVRALAQLKVPAVMGGVAGGQVPVIAEGRYSERWQVEAALHAGAAAVVVGGALNDPVKQTQALRPRFRTQDRASVGAVDIGGTWLRFAVFSGDWKLVSVQKEPNPHHREELLAWLRAQIAASGVQRVGVSTAGIVDPATGEVWKAKEYLMPDHVGIVFSEATLGVPTIAWGDGHATAWGHACLPQFAGRRVATLAIGTGVGCGFVQRGEIWAGSRGEYPRINDLPTASGKSYEELLGGIHLTKTPTEEQESTALEALNGALNALNGLYFPDDIVMAGGVGLSAWMEPHLAAVHAIPSPFGEEAGLYGAAALALFMASQSGTNS